MYSVVLLMAFSGSADAPALGHHGCSGCYGGCYGDCYGNCYGNCNGCCGGGHSCHGGGFFGGHGCNGGHHHGHQNGCCGGCYGCCGGCYGCYGCTGYSCGGCYGCTGYSCGGCTGYSCGGCYGGSAPVVVPAAPVTPPPPEKKDDKKDDKKTEEVNAPAAATILVELPADARLMIDDAATTSTSESRVFVSPELTPGKAFQYTLTAEIVRDGRKLMATERITVRAGEQTRVVLSASKFVTASVAAK
jgi:uncharacterized protein (TIGR03000 family)